MLLPSGTNVPDGPWCLLFPKDTTMKKLVLAVAVLGTVLLAGAFLGYARWQLLDWLFIGLEDPGG